MTLPTFTPPVAPSPGTARRQEIALLKAPFGDGYSQTARDGINHVRKVYDVKWDVLTQGQAAAITAFLEARGGNEAFLYRLPFTPAVLKFTCEEWNQTDAAAGLCSLTATFRQTFNLAN